MTIPTPAAVTNTVTTTHTLSDFDFVLPEALIAQHPAPERTGSRLLDGTTTPFPSKGFTKIKFLVSFWGLSEAFF